jgi:hypothetical protein
VWRSEYHHRKAKLFQQLAKTAPDLVAATQFRMLAAEQLVLARKATAAAQQQQPVVSNVIQLLQGKQSVSPIRPQRAGPAER